MPGFTSVVTNFVKRFPGASRIFQNMVYITATGIIGFGAMLGVNYPAVPGSGESSIVVGLLTKETGTGGISGTGAKVQTIAGVTDNGTLFTKSGGLLYGPLNNPWFRAVTGATVLNRNKYYWPSADGSAGQFLSTNGAGTLSWAAAAGGGGSTGTGSLQNYFDKRYLAVAGDTATGGLLIVEGGAGTATADVGILLEIGGTASGRTLRAINTLASSGTLIVKKNSGTSTGNIMLIDTTGLVYDATNKRVGIGTATPTTALTVAGAFSGSTAPTFSSLKSCDTIDTNANGLLACGTDANSSKIVLLGTVTGGSGNIGASSVAENAVTPTFTGTNSISANTLTQGATIRVRFTGQYQVAAGTLKVRIKLGGGSTNLFIVNSVNGANTAYSAYVDFFLTSAPGASATIAQGGMFNGNQAATVINSVSLSASNATSVPATFSADTTGALAITFTEQFSNSNGSNIFSIDNGSISYELL